MPGEETIPNDFRAAHTVVANLCSQQLSASKKKSKPKSKTSAEKSFMKSWKSKVKCKVICINFHVARPRKHFVGWQEILENMREICIQVNSLKIFGLQKKEEWNKFCLKEMFSRPLWRFTAKRFSRFACRFSTCGKEFQAKRFRASRREMKMFLNLNRKLKFSAKGFKHFTLHSNLQEARKSIRRWEI